MRCKYVTIITAAILTAAVMISATGMVMANDKQAIQARALVEKGVRMAVAEGEEKTLKAIGDPKGPFIDGELYLFAGPLDMVALSAHPYRPLLVGRDLSTFKDSQMFSFIGDFARIAKEEGAGWVEYMWPKPGADEPSLKRTYIMKVPGKNFYIGCGFYPVTAKE